jgi:hypothetical protein
MVLPKFSQLVGLKADTGEMQALGAVGELVNFRATLVTLLEVKNPGEVIGRIMALKGREDEVKTLTARIEADKIAALTTRFDELVKQLGADGKIPPAEIEKKVAVFLKSSGGKVTEDAIASLSLYVNDIKPIAATTTNGTEKKPDPSAIGVQALTASDLAVSRVMGTAPEDVVKYRKEYALGSFTGMKKPLFAILQPSMMASA